MHGMAAGARPLSTNQKFLKYLFGDDWQMAHVCSIEGDPNATGASWAGGPAEQYLSLCRHDTNNYFCISLFSSPLRRKTEFMRTCALVLDDVGPKIDPAKARRLVGVPDWRLETSPGNFHWGYRLDEPITDQDEVDEFHHSLVRGLTGPDGKDPGMCGVTRYMRLPVGWNGKPSAGLGGFTTRLLDRAVPYGSVA